MFTLKDWCNRQSVSALAIPSVTNASCVVMRDHKKIMSIQVDIWHTNCLRLRSISLLLSML